MIRDSYNAFYFDKIQSSQEPNEFYFIRTPATLAEKATDSCVYALHGSSWMACFSAAYFHAVWV